MRRPALDWMHDPLSGRIEIRDETLENGLRVLLQPGHTAPVTTTALAYRVGSRWEAPGRTGISHFLEHMMFKGTRRLAPGEIDLIAQAEGGGNNAYTWLDSTCYQFSMPLDRWRTALAIEADRMAECLLDPREFRTEQAVILEEIRSVRDLPSEALYDELRRVAFPDHPAGRPVLGSARDVARMRVEDLRAWHEIHYAPRNAVLVMVGRFDDQAVMKEILARFGDLPSGPVPPPRPPAPSFQGSGKPVLLKRPAEAPILQLAYPAPAATDPAWAALEALRTILGLGWSSRLVRSLIKDTELASEVYVGGVESRDPDLLTIEIQLRRGQDPYRALERVDRELDRLRRDGPLAWELVKTRQLVETWLCMDHQRSEQRAVMLAEHTLLDRPERGADLQQAVSRLDESTVRDVAARVLEPDRRVVAILQPGSFEPPGGSREPQEYEDRPDARDRRPVDRDLRLAALPSVRFRTARPVRFRTSTGVSCAILPAPHTGVVALRAVIEGGARLDPEGQSGLAFLTAACLRRGTQRWSEEELGQLLESRGIRLGCGAHRHASVLTLSLLPAELPLAVEVLAELLRRPLFPPSEVDRQRELGLSILQAAEDDPFQAGLVRFQRIAYEGDPLGRPPQGELSELAGLERSHVMAAHRAFYRPERTRIYAAGALDAEDLTQRLQEALEGWNGVPTEESLPPPPTRIAAPRRMLHPMEREQVHLYLGHRGIARTDPDWPAILVLNQILGFSAGLADRVNRSLREEQGLAYTVYARFDGGYGSTPGIFESYIGTSPENRSRALQGLRNELEKIRSEGVGQGELIRGRNAVLGGHLFGFETAGDLAGYLHSVDVMGAGDDLRQRLADRVSRVEAGDVLEAARRNLRLDALRLVVCGGLEADRFSDPE